MRQIKVSYRAVFAQPIGKLNPLGAKISAPCPVELFKTGDRWQLREIETPKRTVYYRLNTFASPDYGKDVVTESFQDQLRPWQIWGTVPGDGVTKLAVERMLDPDEIHIMSDGRVLWKEADDYTHIIHAPTLNAGERIPSAACGAHVKAESFISTKANLEPTCKACAHVWREHYQQPPDSPSNPPRSAESERKSGVRQ